MRFIVLTSLCSALWRPEPSHAELLFANGTSDPVFQAWMDDSVDRLYWNGPVGIRRQTCAVSGQPVVWERFAYRNYPGDSIVGCADSIDAAVTQVIAKVDAQLHSVAASSRNDATYPLQFSTLVVFEGVDNIVVYGRFKRAALSTERNAPDDGPPPACTNTARPTAGDPVLLATGQIFQVERDYGRPGSRGLAFQRFYNSPDGTEAQMGVGWRHTYSRRIEVLPSGDAPAQANVIRASGRVVRFVVANGVWSPDATDRSSLERLADGWRYRSDADEIETYDAQGRLQRITSADGYTVTVSRDDAARVATIEDTFGRRLGMSYGADGRLSELRDPAGGRVQFGYEAANNLWRLTQVTDAAGARKTYLHALSRLPAALTGLIDQNGARYASWSYDDTGRVVASEHAGGADRTMLSFGTGSTSVTDALGATRVMGLQTLNGVAFLNTASQPAGSGCSAATRRWSHDAAGNLIEKDDFNQTRTCFAYDGRHRLTRQVDGSSTAQGCAAVLADNAALPVAVRKFSREWHPDWRLETRHAEPGRLVTRVYNGQPDPFNGQSLASCAPADAQLPDGRPIAVLCKEVVQSTTDSDGHLGFGAALQGDVDRVARWTYNAQGQVLTTTEQGAEGESTTSYAYYTDTIAEHTRGDLQSITTAAGDVTRFSVYDKHGLVLESVAPDGSLTLNIYDAMNRLIRTTVDAEAIELSYDPAGQLTRITDDDGGWVGYAYDDAHRRMAAFNHLGHRIDYRLDAAGNAVGQTTNDPDGVLARQLARSIDLLGRVQQLSGKE